MWMITNGFESIASMSAFRFSCTVFNPQLRRVTAELDINVAIVNVGGVRFASSVRCAKR
jgi:hypothetical protein